MLDAFCMKYQKIYGSVYADLPTLQATLLEWSYTTKSELMTTGIGVESTLKLFVVDAEM